MAKHATWSIAIRNAKLNAIRQLFDGGYLRYYGGDQPASPDVAAPGPALAELRFGSPAFARAEHGVLTAQPIASDTRARGGNERPTWYRCFAADGVTAHHDGAISSQDANATTTEQILANAIVDCPRFVIVESAVSAL